MQTSIFIAKILGLVYLVFGLGVLFNGKYYRKLLEDMMKEVTNLYWGGISSLVIGFLIVYYHNVWEYSWVVIITILGWLALLKGVLLIVLPDLMIRWTKAWTKAKSFMPVWGFVILVLGLIFSYFGYLM